MCILSEDKDSRICKDILEINSCMVIDSCEGI